MRWLITSTSRSQHLQYIQGFQGVRDDPGAAAGRSVMDRRFAPHGQLHKNPARLRLLQLLSFVLRCTKNVPFRHPLLKLSGWSFGAGPFFWSAESRPTGAGWECRTAPSGHEGSRPFPRRTGDRRTFRFRDRPAHHRREQGLAATGFPPRSNR